MSDSDSDSDGTFRRRPRRKVVVKVKFEDSSTSDTDDDDDDEPTLAAIAGTSKRSKKLSSTDETDESSNSVNNAHTLRKRKIKPRIYPEMDSSSTDDSYHPDKNKNTRENNDETIALTSTAAIPSTSAALDVLDCSESDSSADLSEKCPICLYSFREQEIGTPNNCQHSFCVPCIDEWSKNVQTCPIDRTPFTSISIRSRFENGAFLREVVVEAKQQCEQESEFDYTNCEVCNSADREESMLLCDGCDKGYHMDCLDPPLTEIPAGSWYCDNCFESESDVTDEDIGQLIEDMEMEVGVPETRLRVRRIDTPRIARTRQSERIMTSIRNRRQTTAIQTNANNRRNRETVVDISLPGPSRRVTTRTSISRRKPRKTRKRRARASRRRSKTYVVEYDVDNFDKKFCIKTTKKVIKRRRKTRKRKTARKRCGGSNRRKGAMTKGATREQSVATVSTRSANRSIEANYPKLHIFGNKNALEYFSDESDNENDDSIGLFGNNSNDGGVAVISSSRTVANTRRLLRNKGIAYSTTTATEQLSTPATTDVLSNIMDTMDRWHTISKPDAIEKIKIDKDGTLIVNKEEKSNKILTDEKFPKNGPDQSDIICAPTYPRSSPAANSNNNFTNSNGYRNNGDAGNGQTQPINYSFNRTDGNSQNNQGSFNNINNRNSFGHASNNNSFGDNFYPRNLSLNNRTPLRQRPQHFDNSRFRRNNAFLNRSETRTTQGLYDDEDVSTSNAFVPQQAPQPLDQSLRDDRSAIVNPQATTSGNASKDASSSASTSENTSNQNIPPLVPPPMPSMFNLDFDGPSTSTSIDTQPTENKPDKDKSEMDAEAINMSLADTTNVLVLDVSQGAHDMLIANYSDSEDGDDDAPGFEYSAESEAVAQRQTAIESLTIQETAENPASMENDEDLVQLDDDEGFSNVNEELSSPDDMAQSESGTTAGRRDESGAEDELDAENRGQKDQSPSTEEKQNESDASADENSTIVSRTESDNFDINDNSQSNEQIDETKLDDNGDKDLEEMDIVPHDNDKAESDISKGAACEETEERSYTPCLDEKNHASDTTEPKGDDQNSKQNDEPSDQSSENQNVKKSVIEGIETELISDDENECIREGVAAKDSKKNKNEKENVRPGKDDSFRKVSKNTKDRNYRDKRDSRKDRKRKRSLSRSLSRLRSRTRSRSRNRGRQTRDKARRRDNKRQDIERYDVRSIIAERQPIPHKDRYGRDASRQRRSRSRNFSTKRGRSKSRSQSPKFSRRRSQSLSRKRSLSRRRSLSRNHSVSPRRSHSISRRRSVSRHATPIRSRRNRHHHRKSMSLSRRSPMRRSRSPPVYASGGSGSPSRGGRLINGQNRRSIDRSRSRSMSPRQNMGHGFSDSRSRSRSKTRNRGKRRIKDKKIKKRTVSQMSPEISPVRRHRTHSRSRSKSWDDGINKTIATPWNNSLSPRMGDETWTPPLTQAPENLTVILKNRDVKKKRDKKKRGERRKTDGQPRREKRKQRTDKYEKSSAPSKEVFASGDNILVSVSFNNNNDKQPPPPPQQTTIVTLPPTKEQILSKKQTDRDGNSKRSRKGNRDSSRKHKKVNIKPVAIIDLDNSPFKEMTPSPRAVIVLTDSEHENDNNNSKGTKNQSNYSNASVSVECVNSETNRELNPNRTSQPQSPVTETASIDMLLGPKTPPEPQLIKFSLPSNVKSKLRTVTNPLHDVNDDEEENMDKDENAENASTASQTQQNLLSQQKVGPNTPPDSGPCSPDVYDPFEPTKSPSPYPDDDECQGNDKQNVGSASASDENNKFDKPLKPVDVKLAFINSKASLDAANSMLSTTLEGDIIESETISNDQVMSPYKEKTVPDDMPPKTTSGIQVFSNILITPGKDSTTRSQQPIRAPLLSLPLPSLSAATNLTAIGLAKSATSLSSSTLTQKQQSSSSVKQSPMKYLSGSSLISKLPLPPKISKSSTRHNGNDDMELESPYSPGSSDYEDLFEPPSSSPQPLASSQGASHSKKQSSQNTRTTSITLKQVAGKTDIFDDLFGSSPPGNASKGTKPPKRRHKRTSIKEWIAVSKHSTQMGYGKLSEDQLRILEDLPGSAVELQAKDKLLRKLNRQERVVEEVKLVLKPHYNKKHITKEEYKEIMRRSVPKICHNRTGEINPKKIQKLIEAYVKKFRHRKKMGGGGTAA